MNGQPTQTREFHVDGPGRQQFHKKVTYGEGHVPTREEFDQMTKVIEGCLDKIQRDLKRLGKEVTNPGSLILDELQRNNDRPSVHDSLRSARLLTAGAVNGTDANQNPSELLRGIFGFLDLFVQSFGQSRIGALWERDHSRFFYSYTHPL